MTKAAAKKAVSKIEDDVVGDFFDDIMDEVETLQMSWKSLPKALQQEFEDKLRDKINNKVSDMLLVLLVRAQDRPTICADLESVKTKKGKTVATLNIPGQPGTDLSELSNQARRGAEVLVLLADPKAYSGTGHSRAEDDQKPLFEDGGDESSF